MDDRHSEPLTPSLLLAFWRQRWGKPAPKPTANPYLQGQLNRLGDWLTHWSAWSLPGLAAASAMVCSALFGVLLTVQFPLNGQLVFAGLMVGLCWYAHRFSGTFVTLVLMGLTSLLLARYLYWRLSATLAPAFGLDLIFGLILCMAELHVWTLMMVSAVRAAWPIREPSRRLPIEQGGWPSVDVLVLCHGHPLETVQSTLAAAAALSWHPKKLKYCILDSSFREEIQTIASAMEATYLIDVDDTDDQIARIHQALAATDGEVIAIIGGDAALHPSFLKSTVGWFLYDAQLGMLQTPGHFLAPKPPRRVLDVFRTVGPSTSYALLRRSMLSESSGADNNTSLAQTHLALKLQEIARSSSYLGFVDNAEASVDDKTGGTVPQAAPETFRIYRPSGDSALLWKLRLLALETWLMHFRPLRHGIFFLAPLAYLLLDRRIIQTSASMWLAYVSPLFVLGLIIKDRKYRDQRIRLWAGIREILMAWNLLILTAGVLVRTEIARFAKILTHRAGTMALPDASKSALAPGLSFVLNLAALAVGTAHAFNSNAKLDELSLLFMCWASYNLMILLGRLAVTEENREVRRYIQSQRHLPAMIRLPSGRTMSCTTENFPETALRLELPTAVSFAAPVVTNLSIFHRNREFSFPVHVTPQDGTVLSTRIDGAALNVYKSLSVAAYSRGHDWPKWLPGRDADQPIPQWMSRAWAALVGPNGWFTRGARKLAHAIGGIRWIHIGKKRK